MTILPLTYPSTWAVLCPEGGRKATEEPDPDQVLFLRLRERARSIEQAENLNLADFWCRWLLVDEIWVPLAERLLIRLYRPVWNVVGDGFGIHDPGAGRRAQKRSDWDVLHPGRTFAGKLPPRASDRGALAQRIARHFAEWGRAHR